MPTQARLGRSMQDLIAIVPELRRRAIGFQSMHEALDTTTPCGRLFSTGSPLIAEGTTEGLAAARLWSARPPATLTPEGIQRQQREATAWMIRMAEFIAAGTPVTDTAVQALASNRNCYRDHESCTLS
ncbi:recombinase family protein [Nocardia tengchongensis]